MLDFQLICLRQRSPKVERENLNLSLNWEGHLSVGSDEGQLAPLQCKSRPEVRKMLTWLKECDETCKVQGDERLAKDGQHRRCSLVLMYEENEEIVAGWAQKATPMYVHLKSQRSSPPSKKCGSIERLWRV